MSLREEVLKGNLEGVRRFLLLGVEPSKEFLKEVSNFHQRGMIAKNGDEILKLLRQKRVELEDSREGRRSYLAEAIGYGDVDAINDALNSGEIVTSKMINDVLADPQGRNADEIAATLIRGYKGIHIGVNGKYTAMELAHSYGFTETIEALKEKRLDDSKAQQVVEVHKMMSLFNVGFPENLARMPEGFGLNLYGEEFDIYRYDVLPRTNLYDNLGRKLNTDQLEARLDYISQVLNAPLSPGHVSMPPVEGDMILLKLGSDDHISQGVLQRRNGEILLHLYDRGDDIYGLFSDDPTRKSQRHITKKISEEDFPEVMMRLDYIRSLKPRDSSDAAKSDFEDELGEEYLDLFTGLETVTPTELQGLSMKGFSTDNCAALSWKASVRMLLSLTFGAGDGERLYKDFSQSSRLLHARDILQYFPTREAFIDYCVQNRVNFREDELLAVKAGDKSDDFLYIAEDFGYLYDRLVASEAKVVAQRPEMDGVVDAVIGDYYGSGYGLHSFFAGEQAQLDVGPKRTAGPVSEVKSLGPLKKDGLGILKALTNSVRSLMGRSEDAASPEDTENARRFENAMRRASLDAKSVALSARVFAEEDSRVADEILEYDDKAEVLKLTQKFFKHLSDVSSGRGVVTQGSLTMVRCLIDMAGDSDHLMVETETENFRVPTKSLENYRDIAEKRYYDRQLETVKKVQNDHSGKYKIASLNFADVLEFDSLVKPSDRDSLIERRLAEKLKMDDSVINREAGSIVKASRNILDSIGNLALSSDSPSRSGIG